VQSPDNRQTIPGWRRWAFAALVGAASAAYVFYYARANPGFVSDFDQVWASAAALWRGENPYLVVGPGRPFHWHWPLYYPMPALVLTAPLGLLPVVAARMVFAGLSAALLAFGITRDGFARWPLFISIPFMVNVELVQWSNLLAAAMLLPLLGGIAAAKPNIGLAMVLHTDRARSLWAMAIGGAVLVTLSFAVLPNWLGFWIQNASSAPHVSPLLLRPGGPLLLAALARWRRPEARLLAALACTPLTPTFYDPTILYLVTKTFREALALTVATFVLFFIVVFSGPIRTAAQWGGIVSTASIWVVYLPCLIMVLRRPNRRDDATTALRPTLA
jgi:hypothetical protein